MSTALTFARPAGVPDHSLAAKITVVEGPDQGREIPLETEVTVGADPASDLALSDPNVSRRHLSVSRADGKVMVKDLGSRNGSFLGGKRLLETPQEIPLGGVITVGQSSLAVRPRRSLQEPLAATTRRFGEMVGISLAMRELFAWVEKVAPTELLLLVEGESGTGKELLARSIHKASAAAAGPFVLFDCRSAAEAEARLFGVRTTSSSGATETRVGAFQEAAGGTLCLDEVGELPLALQGRLMAALESGEILPLGSDTPQRIEARLIALTEQDLHAAVVRGRFRADLAHRLAGGSLRIPSLRSRPEDIPVLTDQLLQGKLAPGARLGGENLGRLMGWSWPGNVGELKRVLHRAAAAATRQGEKPDFSRLSFNIGPEQPATLGPVFPGVNRPAPFKDCKEELLSAFERAYVEALLTRHRGNVTRAAAQAGLSRKHLYDLIKKTSGADPEDPLGLKAAFSLRGRG